MIGVTRLISSYFEEFDAVYMAHKCSQGNNPKYSGRCPVEIAVEWEIKKLRACERGNIAHSLIEDYLKGKEVPKNYTIEFIDEILQHYEFMGAEIKVKNDEYQIRGIVDGLFKNKSSGKLMICDWKTSEKIVKYNKFQQGIGILSHISDCNYNKYSLQLNIYKFLLQDDYDVEDCELFIFHFDDKKEKVVPHIAKDFEDELGLILFERGVL